MSSLNIKQDNVSESTGYSQPTANANEIDLVNLIETLWRVRTKIIATVFAFACVGILVSFLLPQRWTSRAIVALAEAVQWQGLENTLTKLRVLDMDISISRGDVFNLLIKKFQSSLLLEECLRSSPYVMDQLKGADIDEMELHQTTVRLSEKMRAADTNLGKKNEASLYTLWTLSFTAPRAEEAQSVLKGYIQYIPALVVKEMLEDIRSKLSIKTSYEKERLGMDRVRLKNQLEANIQRLNYLLETANAVGIKKPVYSNGRAVKDDSDFSTSLSTDGIERKLEIEKSVTDVAEINGELCNRQYHVEQLLAMNVSDVKFTSFKYRLSPSLPVKKDGPVKSTIVILATLLGGMVVYGGILLNHAMISRKQEMMLIDQQLV